MAGCQTNSLRPLCPKQNKDQDTRPRLLMFYFFTIILFLLTEKVYSQQQSEVCYNCQNSGCFNYGSCLNNVCSCHDGFGGPDCGSVLCGSVRFTVSTGTSNTMNSLLNLILPGLYWTLTLHLHVNAIKTGLALIVISVNQMTCVPKLLR